MVKIGDNSQVSQGSCYQIIMNDRQVLMKTGYCKRV